MSACDRRKPFEECFSPIMKKKKKEKNVREEKFQSHD